jgi:anthranilate synthase component 1
MVECLVNWVTVFGSASQVKQQTRKVSFKRLHTRKSPSELFHALHHKHDYVYLLESVTGPRKLAEYSFIGFEPHSIISVKNRRLTVTDTVSGETTVYEAADPLTHLRVLLASNRVVETAPRLLGGAVGYLSYDAIRYWERLPDTVQDDSDYPDAEFALYDDGVIFDHQTQQIHYYTIGEEDRSRELLLESSGETPEPLAHSALTRNLNQTHYEEMVLKAKEYISAGDIFQTVLSQRLNTTLRGDPHAFYEALHSTNPSPYMYHLKMGDRRILGSSPEMLIRVEKDVVETFPIAGTRPRTSDNTKNQLLAQELIADPKDRAEHVMLVDLARNDLGRIGRYGTVKTTEFMQIHEYSHVQHIVSHVRGQLKPEYDAYDALRAVFPAGTVSGAPKIRAMEIIDELEPTRRGPYAGAVGYFSYNGNSDFAITIRTLTTTKDHAYVQAGAGIVADSDPSKEWMETRDKAAALVNALNLASQEKKEKKVNKRQ